MSGFSPNPVLDVQEMLSWPFMLNALRAGTVVAVVAGVVGYLMVVRSEAFVGHTLSVVGFPGAAGAAWLGLPVAAGYFAFAVVAALVLAAVGGRQSRQARGGSAAVATVQAVALALGYLFVGLYHGYLSGLTSLLFGSITGITTGQVGTLLAAGVVTLAASAVIGRPLFFASVDAETARAAGVPVRLLSAVWLVILAVAVAGTGQVTGSLLVFALLVAPAATALRLTARPATGILLSVGIAVAVTWLGETAAFFSPYPIGFWVTTFAFACYLLALGARSLSDGRSRRRVAVPATGNGR